MNLAEYTRFDAVALAELVRSRQVTPFELAQLAVEAATALQPQLNFIAHDLSTGASERAREPVTGSFAGVPFMLKDLALEMKGTPYEAGSRLLKGHVSAADTNLMLKFREAGLIVTAKTTCAEFGAQLTTETLLHGVTRNPWSLEHTPGGSSGGSAAAVASGVVPFAHANDGIGSIRIPAANCGLFGLKPTRQRVPLGPFLGDAPGSRGVEFVVSRTVRDAAVLLDCVHGADVGAHSWAPPPVRPFRAELNRPQRGLKIALMTRSFSGAAIHPLCVEAVRQTASMCEALGHLIEPAAPQIDFESFRRAIRIESNANSVVGLKQAAGMMRRELGPDTLEPFTQRIYEEGQRASAEDYARSIFTYGLIERQIGAFFSQYDILLTPALSIPTPRIGYLQQPAGDYEAFWERFCGDAYSPFAGVFNVTGHPAASMPLFFSADGLPIGTQVVARFGMEGTLLNLAAQLESAYPWIHRLPTVHVKNL
jgi:amidase